MWQVWIAQACNEMLQLHLTVRLGAMFKGKLNSKVVLPAVTMDATAS